MIRLKNIKNNKCFATILFYHTNHLTNTFFTSYQRYTSYLTWMYHLQQLVLYSIQEKLRTNMRITTDPTAEIVQCAVNGKCCSEQVTKINPISPLYLGKKCLTLNSSEGDRMKSHDLRNLVSDISEIKWCDYAVTLFFRYI